MGEPPVFYFCDCFRSLPGICPGVSADGSINSAGHSDGFISKWRSRMWRMKERKSPPHNALVGLRSGEEVARQGSLGPRSKYGLSIISFDLAMTQISPTREIVSKIRRMVALGSWRDSHFVLRMCEIRLHRFLPPQIEISNTPLHYLPDGAFCLEGVMSGFIHA